jgi:predicted nicotinamide N-methyase
MAMWPAGILLADYLSNSLQSSMLLGRVVVELGCGLGLCGIVASMLAGPSGVVAITDGDDGVVTKAIGHINENYCEASDARILARVLWWSKDATDAKQLLRTIDEYRVATATTTTTTTRTGANADADVPCATEGANLVLGSDLLYEAVGASDRAASLAATAVALLHPTSDDATFLYSLERRLVPEQLLIDEMAAHGFACRIVPGYIEDVFGNLTDEPTDFWHRCILEFKRAKAVV